MGTDSIYNMHVMNTDAVSYQSRTPKKCMETTERENNKKYLHACLNKCLHLNTFVTSMYGLLKVEAEAALKHIASRLTAKWKEHCSRNYRYVKIRV